ncbi:MAG: hypothetical protein H6917_05535 [Novosphingobium sp.]|nr:hypothetical protein [Novosphingobium sp.]MCP5401831.1 hypothetical protein [Novosphingobium sp.]
MIHTVEFCEARAEEAASEARSTQLENVRQRALRSEAAWRAFGSRLALARRNRAALDSERVSAS